MASGLYISHAQATAQLNAMNIPTTGFGGAHLKIYSSAAVKPADANAALPGNAGDELLADFTLPAAGSNVVSNNVLTFGAIADVVAGDTGTAAWYRITASNGTTVVCDGTVGLVGDTPDLVLNSVEITNGATVKITSFTYTITE